MNVKELIAELQKMDADATVVMEDVNCDHYDTDSIRSNAEEGTVIIDVTEEY